MSKENERTFIIAERNLEPAPPEFMYYCGAVSPIRNIQACIATQEVRWDYESKHAYKLSFDAAVEAYGALTQLGFVGLVVYQIVSTLQPIDSTLFEKAGIRKNIEFILSGMDDEDIKYLQTAGILDLSQME